VLVREKLSARLETLPEGELLWRGDSVAFPPGGCAYLHRHQGPGIRCLIDGELRVDAMGQSHTYQVGGAWYETGPDPVFAQAGERPTRFIRVMILPRALMGKSSIQYVNEDDKAKPKAQQYRVFVDAPLTRP
jgi:quercetin dioxygenase-like cupin family protein